VVILEYLKRGKGFIYYANQHVPMGLQVKVMLSTFQERHLL
jgi:hypothetical protein